MKPEAEHPSNRQSEGWVHRHQVAAEPSLAGPHSSNLHSSIEIDCCAKMYIPDPHKLALMFVKFVFSTETDPPREFLASAATTVRLVNEQEVMVMVPRVGVGVGEERREEKEEFEHKTEPPEFTSESSILTEVV
ncbi:hypothetical protein BLNAU_24356 [Blattamonas nauphoetae]|uniref:Uncharacterized protein n=1 Tax=Blattamonas nauphoetae TaxID=2049346 RepID=A0ABQ9WNK2_9EUKA|nr:hypothetical protein BLNAU_24356 [Blattamonas nauphoetae]